METTVHNKPQVKLWTRDFALIIVINLLVFTNHIMNLSTFPFYVESLGGNESVAGIVATAFSLVAVALRPFIGWMLDNGKRRLILVLGLVGLAVAPMGYLSVPVLSVAIVFRMLHGASLACSNTTTATIASDVIPGPRFAEGMGLFGMATALATAIAPALGLALMNKGFNVLFIVGTALAVLALVLFQLVRTPKIEVSPKPLDVRALFNSDALPASAIMLVFMLTFGALENFLPKFAVENGLPSGGIFFAIMAVMLLLVRVFLGKLVDRRGEGIFVYTCNAAMMAAFLLMAFAPSRSIWRRFSRAMALAAWSRPCRAWPSTPPATRAAARQTPPSCAPTTSALAWARASRASSSPTWATAPCGRSCRLPAS